MYKSIIFFFLLLFAVLNAAFLCGSENMSNIAIGVAYYASAPLGDVVDSLFTLLLTGVAEWSQKLDLYISMVGYCIGGAIQYAIVAFVYHKIKARF